MHARNVDSLAVSASCSRYMVMVVLVGDVVMNSQHVEEIQNAEKKKRNANGSGLCQSAQMHPVHVGENHGLRRPRGFQAGSRKGGIQLWVLRADGRKQRHAS